MESPYCEDPDWEPPLNGVTVIQGGKSNPCSIISSNNNTTPPDGISDKAKALWNASEELSGLAGSGNFIAIQRLFSQYHSPTNPEYLERNALAWFQNSTALELASERDNTSLTKYLLEQGLTPSKPAVDAAVDRAKKTGSTELLQLYLDHGWDINQPCHLSAPPTLFLVLRDEDLVRWYLSHGASPNGTCPIGDTVMTRAVQFASLTVLQLLVECGSMVQGTDLVAHATRAHCFGEPGRIEVIEYLLELGAPIDKATYEDWDCDLSFSLRSVFGEQNALHIAVEGGKHDVVELLLSRGADKSLRNRRGQSDVRLTPLEIAEKRGHTEIAEMLRD